MTTCTWTFRRHAAHVLAAASVVAAGIGLTAAPPATADQLSTLRAQAQAVEAHIQALGQQEAALAEQYDGAQLGVQAANAKVASAAAQVAAAQAAAAHARAVLGAAAVDEYTGAASAPTMGAGSSGLDGATASLLGAEYVDSVAADQQDALDSYHLAMLQAKTAEGQLEAAKAAAQAQVTRVAAARSAVQATQSQLQGVERQTQGQITTLVAQIQAQQEAAAQAAAAAAAARAAQEAARQRAAQAAARAVVTVAAPVSSFTSAPPPSGAGASGAVQAALSRVGDPYVWGAAGPNEFDCSGLVEWAYAQVGISLPHYSGAQYSDGTRIPMSDLRPGDLVFFSNPGEHVAMYVGGGDIVEAPHSGATVHVVPMYSEFVQAVRIS